MSPRTVVVIGATGSQGGSVARELLKSPHLYRVRAITRDPSKPAAQELAAIGAELRCADLSEGAEALAAVFAGANAIFALTDFWATQSSEAEIAQGRAIVDAAARTSTLQHLVWSALPDPEKLSGGALLHIHHWKGKSIVTDYIHQQYPALWAMTTTVLFPNYFENCLTHPDRYLSKPDAQGVYNMSFPHSPHTVMPNVSIRDTGKLVQLVLESGTTYFAKTIAFYNQALAEADKLAAIGEKYNLRTKYHTLNADEFQRLLETRDGMSPEIALDFTEQLLMFEKFGNVYDSPEFVQAKEIPGLKLQTWVEFLEENNLLAYMKRS
ncbi:NmrA/HSCARG family protein [Aspergillus homomorphus CBS 101889]|uniref:NmrA-like family protein n=1 Tax=Aspergillus homomorphus (strain CBS 101889) TaxID=1450537 RepID=A0A395HVS2_ASPHC|nr:NmrA-like family protein [Aspergillus homomorphus CBS 101889]RAL11495.1 NmrA-like family protein [Aspergillus homomorphus CBS 101889]